jgi:hypothetical protein
MSVCRHDVVSLREGVQEFPATASGLRARPCSPPETRPGPSAFTALTVPLAPPCERHRPFAIFVGPDPRAWTDRNRTGVPYSPHASLGNPNRQWPHRQWPNRKLPNRKWPHRQWPNRQLPNRQLMAAWERIDVQHGCSLRYTNQSIDASTVFDGT